MKDNLQALIQIALELWRFKKRLSKEEISTNCRKLLDTSFERLENVLKEAKIDVVDNVGKPYNDGMEEEVIYSEHLEGLPDGTRIVSETIKPSISRDGKLVVSGQIIVGKNNSMQTERGENDVK
ncbi:MAG: hypothetical protein ABI444_11245 [Candidatus Kapaibacterium sp.]|jgi:hypothetical protein